MEQIILNNTNLKDNLLDILNKNGTHTIMWICTNSFRKQNIYLQFKEIMHNYAIVEFSDFTPNPQYESVCRGVNLFRENNANFIIATGGGSALDIAKCIKMFARMQDGKNYLEQTIFDSNIPILAVPTTAGAGSEATRFAVIYYQNKKYSVSHESCIPNYVLFEPAVLRTLPEYQKKVTMFDALCHAIESFWSIRSTEESLTYSKEAIRIIMEYEKAYWANTKEGNRQMLRAAYIAGKAINITQTTAGHAMSYKLTNLYGIAHGHAVALCVSKLWPYMLNNLDQCIDKRGKLYLNNIFNSIAQCMNCTKAKEAADKFEGMIAEYGLKAPTLKTDEDISMLCESVNVERLKNNPIYLDKTTINKFYKQILYS